VRRDRSEFLYREEEGGRWKEEGAKGKKVKR
jgi:hypothetical protein